MKSLKCSLLKLVRKGNRLKIQQTKNSPANFSYDYRIPLDIQYEEGSINKTKNKEKNIATNLSAEI